MLHDSAELSILVAGVLYAVYKALCHVLLRPAMP